MSDDLRDLPTTMEFHEGVLSPWWNDYGILRRQRGADLAYAVEAVYNRDSLAWRKLPPPRKQRWLAISYELGSDWCLGEFDSPEAARDACDEAERLRQQSVTSPGAGVRP